MSDFVVWLTTGSSEGTSGTGHRGDPDQVFCASTGSGYCGFLDLSAYGEPDGGGLSRWPRCASKDRCCLILDAQSRVEHDIDLEHQRHWGDR